MRRWRAGVFKAEAGPALGRVAPGLCHEVLVAVTVVPLALATVAAFVLSAGTAVVLVTRRSGRHGDGPRDPTPTDGLGAPPIGRTGGDAPEAKAPEGEMLEQVRAEASAIVSQAEREARQILESAEREARAIVESAERVAGHLVEDGRRAGREEYERIASRVHADQDAAPGGEEPPHRRAT